MKYILTDTVHQRMAAILVAMLAFATIAGCPVQDPCVRKTLDSYAAADKDPSNAEAEFQALREVYRTSRKTKTAEGYITEGPPDSPEGKKAWVGFLCFLADRGNAKASKIVGNLQVEKRDGASVSLEVWLGTTELGLIDPAWAAKSHSLSIVVDGAYISFREK